MRTMLCLLKPIYYISISIKQITQNEWTRKSLRSTDLEHHKSYGELYNCSLQWNVKGEHKMSDNIMVKRELLIV